MILNELISRYLDGELTPEEDMLLRDALAADSEAKEAFDTAVLVHVHMQCEPLTAVPPELEQKTLNAVFAEMDSDARFQRKIQSTRSITERNVRGFGTRAVALVACLLLLVLPTHDTWFNGEFAQKVPGTKVENAQSAQVSNTVSSEKRYTATRIQNRIVTTEDVAENEPTTVLNEQGTSTVENINQLAATNELPPTTLRSVFASNAAVVGSTTSRLPETVTNPGDNGGSSELLASNNTPLPVYDEKYNAIAPVSLDATYSSGFGTSLPSISNVQQLTQSTGFVVDETMVVGIEVGLTSYSMEYEGRTVSSGSTPSRRTPSTPTRGSMVSSIEVMQQNPIDVSKLVLSQGSVGGLPTMPYNGVADQRMFWGSAFVQTKLLSLSKVNVLGRAGAGVGQDGALAYSRLQAEYKLLDRVSMSVGAEFSGMPFRNSVKQGQATAIQLGFSFAALTSLRVQL